MTSLIQRQAAIKAGTRLAEELDAARNDTLPGGGNGYEQAGKFAAESSKAYQKDQEKLLTIAVGVLQELDVGKQLAGARPLVLTGNEVTSLMRERLKANDLEHLGGLSALSDAAALICFDAASRKKAAVDTSAASPDPFTPGC